MSTAVVGLSNLGNTCYLNAALQLLLACEPFMAELQQQQQQQQQPDIQAAAKCQAPASCATLGQQGSQQEAATASHFGKGPLGSALQEALLHVSGESVVSVVLVAQGLSASTSRIFRIKKQGGGATWVNMTMTCHTW